MAPPHAACGHCYAAVFIYQIKLSEIYLNNIIYSLIGSLDFLTECFVVYCCVMCSYNLQTYLTVKLEIKLNKKLCYVMEACHTYL